MNVSFESKFRADTLCRCFQVHFDGDSLSGSEAEIEMMPASTQSGDAATSVVGRMAPPPVGRHLRPSDLPLSGRMPAIQRRCVFRQVHEGDKLYRIGNEKQIHFRGCQRLVTAMEDYSQSLI